jgi:hypothetical protein
MEYSQQSLNLCTLLGFECARNTVLLEREADRELGDPWYHEVLLQVITTWT